jgi:hypothetical protein
VACVGGGSNAIGIFQPFVDDADVQLVGVEAAGTSIESGKHSATLSAGTVGVLHGSKTYMLQDDNGQVVFMAVFDFWLSANTGGRDSFNIRWPGLPWCGASALAPEAERSRPVYSVYRRGGVRRTANP